MALERIDRDLRRGCDRRRASVMAASASMTFSGS